MRQLVKRVGKSIEEFKKIFEGGILIALPVGHQLPIGRGVRAGARSRRAGHVPKVAWLDWGPYLDGQVTFRFLLRRDSLLRQLRRAVDTGEVSEEISPFVPRAGHCTRQDFEATGCPVEVAGGRVAVRAGGVAAARVGVAVGVGVGGGIASRWPT